MMGEQRSGYQEFMRNKKVLSRFDPSRKEITVKKQLSSNLENQRDYTRLNMATA